MRNKLTRTDTLSTVASNNYYKKPVEEISSKIIDSNEKRIILQGVKGAGKSTVLYHNRNNTLYTPHVSIISTFHNSIPFFGINDLFTKEYYEYFYELEISFILLSQIKLFYSDIFDKHFTDIYEEITKRLKELTIYTRISNKEQKNLKEILAFGSLTDPIIRTFKKEVSLQTLDLQIDQFEYNSPYHQANLVNYDKIFDQLILACNIECVSPNLEEKGYKIIDVNYGKNKEVLREILKQRIIEYNISIEKEKVTFPFNKMTDNIIEALIELSNGNISIVLDSLYIASETLFSYKNASLNDITSYLQREIDKKEKTEKMYPAKKLHL